MSASSADANGTSTQTFISALVLNTIVAGAEVVAFIILKNKFRKVYAPRSYLPAETKRSPVLSRTFLGWIPEIIKADPELIIASNGLDAYMFLRFLRFMCMLFIPAWALTWVILLPVYAAQSAGTKTGLDRFTFGNVGLTKQPRYAAPLIIVWIFSFYAFYLIRKEIMLFIVKRQDYLISPEHAALPQSRTVLLTGVPPDMLDLAHLEKYVSYLPGGARKIWLSRDLKDLPDLYARRLKAFAKLESGETGLMKVAHKRETKRLKKEAKGKKMPPPVSSADAEKNAGQEAELWTKYLPAKKRPTHRLGLLGLIGKKVDTINWAKDEIAVTTKELDQGRGHLDDFKAQNSVFIEFNQQIAAHMFAQSLSHHMPLTMTGRWIEVAPEDVVWSTLNIPPLQQRVRYLISWAITIAIIVLWAFPVAFVGLISNINSLCATVSWMRWLCNLPAPVPGIIQGILPPVLLAVLFMLLPIVLRMLAIFEGIPLHSLVERSLMTRYFMFLVIHGFLIVTLSSGLVAAIPQITKNPSSAVTILAQQLPKASTFFLTYIAVTGAGIAGSLLQIVPVVLYYVKMFLLASTPRSVYNIRSSMGSVAWGTLFPNVSLLCVIALSYTIVSPLVVGFAACAFLFYWFAFKYLFVYVYDMPPAGETGGLFFPLAIGHIFCGMYIMQVFLCALFFFAQDANGKQSALGEGAVMVILIIITFLFHMLINTNYHPVIEYLPVSLAPRSEAAVKQALGGGTSGSPDYSNGQGGGGLKHGFGDEKSNGANGTGPAVSQQAQGGGGADPEKGKYSGQKPGENSKTKTAGGELDPRAFDHPASYDDLNPVWVPSDSFGMGDAAIRDLRASGIDATDDGAEMDDKGGVHITRNPPGEDELIELPAEDPK